MLKAASWRTSNSLIRWKAGRVLPQKTAAWPNLAVAIETSQGAAVDQLLQREYTVFPVHPVAAQSYRERKAPSGTKTDHLDAWALADALRVDGQNWKALQPLDPMTQQLRLLCRDEVSLIEQRTALVNQLQQALVEYYPAALEAFDGLDRRLHLGVRAGLSYPAGPGQRRQAALGEVPPHPQALAARNGREAPEALRPSRSVQGLRTDCSSQEPAGCELVQAALHPGPATQALPQANRSAVPGTSRPRSVWQPAGSQADVSPTPAGGRGQRSGSLWQP